MSIASDLDKGLTLGDADGPDEFVPSLGLVVPTFIDSREDLIGEHARGKFKRLHYHVPFRFRGDFKKIDWPMPYQEQHHTVRTDMAGFVLCSGINRSGGLCGSRAVNRSFWCRNHGGALAAPDKKMSGMTIAPIQENRVNKLDRVQKFMQGLISTDELDDDEIKGQFVRNDEGTPVSTAKLGVKFVAQLHKELLERLNHYLRSETPEMLKIMVNIAKNDLYEAQDRLRAAQWVSERTMGKVADVHVLSTTDRPFMSILDSLSGGSREDYRRSIESKRTPPGGDAAPYEIIEAEITDDNVDVEESSVDHGTNDDETSSRGDDASESSDSGALDHARGIVEQRQDRLDRIKALKKAKQKRYAARAVGATSLSAMPWLVEYVAVHDIYGVTTGYKMKLWLPDKQTPTLIERLRVSASAQEYDPVRHAGELEAAAAQMQAKIEALTRGGSVRVQDGSVRKGDDHGEPDSQPEHGRGTACDAQDV